MPHGNAGRPRGIHPELAACSLAVPRQGGKEMRERSGRRVADAGGGLATYSVRSLELWWNASGRRMDSVMVAERADLSAYCRAMLNEYPGAVFTEMDHTMPPWFDRADSSSYRMFCVEVHHGIWGSGSGGAGIQRLMTYMANAVQVSSKAWIQSVFSLCPPADAARPNAGDSDLYGGGAGGGYRGGARAQEPGRHGLGGRGAAYGPQSGWAIVSTRCLIKGGRDVDLIFGNIDPEYAVVEYGYGYGGNT